MPLEGLRVLDVASLFAGPLVATVLGDSIIELPDEELGHVKMQNVLFRMLGTPGQVRWPGRGIGHDNAQVYAEIGISPE